jgi:Protein of unknown function (DUF3501)
LRGWLPRLVGVERSLVIRLGASGGEVRSVPEESHAEHLTREDVTSSVHYVRFELGPREIERFAQGPVSLACDHPAYKVEVELSEATRGELLKDLMG